MITLTARARRVLDYLLQVKEPVSTAQIASRLDATPGQVRYCLRHAQLWLRQRGADLFKRQRVGIEIQASTAQKKALLAELKELKGYGLALSPDERKQLLLLRLLVASNPLSLHELCERLGVSRTTVFRDLASVRKWLERRGLRLSTHRHHGMLAEGAERPWREAVLETLLCNLDQGVLVAACVGSEPQSLVLTAAHQSFRREADSLLTSLDLRLADQLVTSLERQVHLLFLDEARTSLILCVGLSLLRVPMGKPVSEDVAPPATTQETEAARAMVMDMAQHLGQALPTGEIRYLADKIVDTIKRGSIADREQRAPFGNKPDGSAIELATLLAEEAGKYLHAGLSRDRELINCLALEMSAPPPRWPTGTSLGDRMNRNEDGGRGPLYGLAHRLLCPILESRGYVPTERLLACVATHLSTALERLSQTQSCRKVWVICGAGVATARNLISRLNLRLPGLQILGMTSASAVAHDPQLVSDADAVISTVPLHCHVRVPVLYVSPMLTPEDTEMLRVALGIDRRKPQYGGASSACTGLSISEVLSPATIDLDARADSWEEVVDQAGTLLLQTGAIWPSYIEAMKDMIRLYGPYVVVAPGAALLHAGPEMGSKRLAMSLVVLRKGVPFGHELHDPVHVALAFSSVGSRAHVRIVGEAMRLLGDKHVIRSMITAVSVTEIVGMINRMTNGEQTHQSDCVRHV